MQAILILFRSQQNIIHHYLLSTHMKATLFIVSFFYLSFSSTFAQQWTSISSFPGTQRDDGVCFVIQDQAYCGTGLEVGWAPTRNFYKLTMSTQQWVSVASMPANTERQYACAFSMNNKGYVFGGVNADALNDLWEYDPNVNAWSALAPKPGHGLSGASCFVLNDTVIFVGGANSATQASKQVWAYIVSSNSWLQRNDFPFLGLWRASACSVNDVGYLLGGKDSTGHFNQNLYRYYPATDTWSTVHTSPLTARIYASSCSVLSQLVMMAGLDSAGIYHDDVNYFNFADSTWITIPANLPTPRKGGMCFSNYTSLFYATGIDSDDVRLNETLVLTNPTKLVDHTANQELSIFPIPVNDELQILSTSCEELSVYDMLGNLMVMNKGQSHIQTAGLSAGTYLLSIKTHRGLLRRTFIKT